MAMVDKTDISLIRKYLNGDLDERAMYQLERRAQDDPALMDIMLGMELGSPLKDEADLHEIDARIAQRTRKNKVVKLIGLRSWAIAASVILISSLGIWWLKGYKSMPTSVVQNINRPAVPEKPVDPLVPEAQVKAKLSEQSTVVASVIHKRKSAALNRSVMKTGAEREATPVASAEAKAPMALMRAMSAKDSAMQSTTVLNEVKVVGYAPQRKQDVTNKAIASDSSREKSTLEGRIAGLKIGAAPASIVAPEPANGWKAYNRYLGRKAKKIDGITGEVVLTFDLDKDGKPKDIVILKGLVQNVDQRAVEILQKGSSWVRPLSSTERITLTIHFQ